MSKVLKQSDKTMIDLLEKLSYYMKKEPIPQDEVAALSNAISALIPLINFSLQKD